MVENGGKTRGRLSFFTPLNTYLKPYLSEAQFFGVVSEKMKIFSLKLRGEYTTSELYKSVLMLFYPQPIFIYPSKLGYCELTTEYQIL